MNEEQVRDMLAAISDALSPPLPGTYEGIARRHELVSDRAAFIAGSLRAVLGGEATPEASTDGIRDYVALTLPLPYQPKRGQS